MVTIPFPIQVLEAENGMTSSWAAYTSLVVLFTSKPNNNGAKTLQYYYIVYLAAIYKHTQLQLKRIKNEERNFVQQKLILHNYNIATDISTINIINKKTLQYNFPAILYGLHFCYTGLKLHFMGLP